MNIRIPVPKSSGSELFDDECRSTVLYEFGTISKMPYRSRTEVNYSMTSADHRCRTEYSIDFSLEMGNEIDRVAVTGNGNENRRITESTVRLDARILGPPQSLS